MTPAELQPLQQEIADYFDAERVNTIIYDENPFLAMVPKKKDVEDCDAQLVRDYVYTKLDERDVKGMLDGVPAARDCVFLMVEATLKKMGKAIGTNLFRNGLDARLTGDKQLTLSDSINIYEKIVVASYGVNSAHAFVSYGNMNDLLNVVGSNHERITWRVDNVGFWGVRLPLWKGDNGEDVTVDVFADGSCSNERVYCLDLSEWQLLSTGEPVTVCNDVRQAKDGGAEVCSVSCMNLVRRKRSRSVVVSLTA